MSIRTSVRQHVYEFLGSGTKTRDEIMDFRRTQRIGAMTWKTLEIDYNVKMRRQAEAFLSLEEGIKPVLEEDEEREVTQVMKALKSMATEGKNAFAAKVWLQVKGKLTEKQEVTHKIDGGFYARAVLEAERQLKREQFSGVDKVQEESPLLCPPVLLSEGQAETPDNQV